jgi:nucleoside-triphosphatase
MVLWPSGVRMKGHALLLTGVPGVGKTTVLRKVADEIRDRTLRGFLTDEIREGGARVGFRIETLGGESARLAHVRSRSRYRVGRYRVDVEALDRIVFSTLGRAEPRAVYFIDEIGKMECFSTKFIEAVSCLLDSGQIVLASVARKGGGFIDGVKRRPDVELWEVTRGNRDQLPGRILAWLAARL